MAFDVARGFDAIEEGMVPSYCHRNLLAAGVSWWRLLTARALSGDVASRGPVLDFGAATGELYHVLGAPDDYSFVEQNDLLARALLERAPLARRIELEQLPDQRFGTIYALDALEHNEDPAAIVERLAPALSPEGCLVASGPTESALYRLGRRVAGFEGHYHRWDVQRVEEVLAGRLERIARAAVPPLAPLFRLSVWRRREPWPL